MNGRMADQHGDTSAEAGARIRIAMNVGAELAKANEEVTREPYGVELARRAATASRAAVLALIDNDNADSPGMPLPIVQGLVQQSYGGEWQRLQGVPREEWRQ